jgi:hypothetical protein
MDPEKQRLLVHNEFLKHTKVIVVLASAQVEERRIRYGPDEPPSHDQSWARFPYLTYMLHGAAVGSMAAESEAVEPPEGTNGSPSGVEAQRREQDKEDQQENSSPLLSLSESLAEVARHAPALISFKYTALLAQFFVPR